MFSLFLNDIKQNNQNQREDRVNQEKFETQAGEEAGQKAYYKK